MQGTVALTGATGFVGNVFLENLLNDGWTVRALTRRRHSSPEHPGLDWINGDLHDQAALVELVAGADAVIHCAGTVRGRSQAQFDRINVEGTANLVAACKTVDPLPRFLLISSLAARQPELSWYAGSKRRAEEVLEKDASGMPWTAFRPTAIYGKGDRELKPLFKAMQRHGVLPMPGFANTRFSLLHVDDLARAMLCWLRAGKPVPGTFELADARPHGYDRHALADVAAEVWGRPVKTVSLPPAIVYLASYVNLVLAHVCRYSPMLTPGKVRELLYPDWVCDNTSITSALPDWQPGIHLTDALPGVL